MSEKTVKRLRKLARAASLSLDMPEGASEAVFSSRMSVALWRRWNRTSRRKRSAMANALVTDLDRRARAGGFQDKLRIYLAGGPLC